MTCARPTTFCCTAAARGKSDQVWRSVEELSGYARSAERTLDDPRPRPHGHDRRPTILRDGLPTRRAGAQDGTSRAPPHSPQPPPREIGAETQVAGHHLCCRRARALAHFDSAPQRRDVAGLCAPRLRTWGADLAAPGPGGTHHYAAGGSDRSRADQSQPCRGRQTVRLTVLRTLTGRTHRLSSRGPR